MFLNTKYQPPLRDCKGPLPVQQQLANGVREDLDKLWRQIQVKEIGLDVFVGDQQGERNQIMLKQVIEEKLKSRATPLASKRVIDSISLSNQDELLQLAASKQQTAEERGKASNVTGALRRTIGLMQGELEQSVLIVQMLESSTKTLQATSTAHDALTFTMNASKTLITALAKSDWQDHALIIAGLVFFLCIVLLIIKECVLDRGICLAFWWTRFIPDCSGDKEF
ncbi:hypothetical protein Moror_12688 [Moniliophthora roreri MCA 2997]|uniref:Sec20 C-terminal domain-containing protein n=1 Tax=Moniliophthora roreri (strain MCA 2997) TaxID=1381753 RepID=V2XP28_MONRO|nr:hypothetical protein Moror_12688 [Moniliophthora roreri MCA 2997]